MENDVQKLERILSGIEKYAGETTIPEDVYWVQEIQRTKPEWAKNTLDKYAKMRHNFPGVR